MMMKKKKRKKKSSEFEALDVMAHAILKRKKKNSMERVVVV